MMLLQAERIETYDAGGRAVALAGPTSGWVFGVAIALGVVVWLLVARSSLVRGGSMERPERVPQLYGYSVCLIAIVVMLVSVSSIVDKLFVLSDPLASGGRFGWGGGPVLTSYEAYKATLERMTPPTPAGRSDTTAAKPTEAEMRARYEALRADQLERSRLEGRRDLTSSTLLLVIAAGLFWWHWRWVRRLASASDAGAAARPPAA